MNVKLRMNGVDVKQSGKKKYFYPYILLFTHTYFKIFSFYPYYTNTIYLFIFIF
jgi:hypothetical protein